MKRSCTPYISGWGLLEGVVARDRKKKATPRRVRVAMRLAGDGVRVRVRVRVRAR
jgi:hypothetical protein